MPSISSQWSIVLRMSRSPTPRIAADARATSNAARVREVLAWLKQRGTQRDREGMARYGIRAEKVFGVSVASLRELGKRIGRDHALAEALWKTGWYEARMLTAFIDEPARVTPAQMDRWAKDFENWAVCDGLCFHLFDSTRGRRSRHGAAVARSSSSALRSLCSRASRCTTSAAAMNRS